MGAALIVLSGLVWLLRRRVASLMGESAAGLAAIPTDLFQAVSGLRQRGETGHFILLALGFQFKRRGMPMAPVFTLLTGGLEKAGRIWVITQPPPGPLLENLLNSAGGRIKEFKQPELVEKYPQATLYLMVREKALTSAVR